VGGSSSPLAFFITFKGDKIMKPITNIYLLIDNSFRMSAYNAGVQNVLIKTQRALSFLPEKTKLHIWNYNDLARIRNLKNSNRPYGNPNLGEGLKMLENIMLYQRKYSRPQTRSIFILHAGDSVLQGWEQPLNELFKLKEFAFGLRYVVTYGNPDSYARKAFVRFTDTPDRILPYFSENRLCSLIKSL
jgi:hypothetical protein